MDGFHVESVPQDKGDFLFSAEIGEPIPGEHAFDRDDEPLTVGSNGLEERFRSGFHITVQQGLTIVAHDADVHGPGMQVDTAVKLVWVGVESHEVSSFLGLSGFSHDQHTTGVCGGGGLNHYQRPRADGLQRSLVPRSRFQPQLRPGVDMTSAVKSWLLIFFHLLYPVYLRHRKRWSQ